MNNQNIINFNNKIQETTQNNVQLNTNNNSEIQEYFNYLNVQNNMNLKKIILFYSKYSKLCEQFVNSLHPNYKIIINMISVDNSAVRKRIMNSKYKLQYVPCVFMLFDNGKINIHQGKELLSLVTFLNKNMEAFMINKTNENLSKRKNNQVIQSQGITPIISKENMTDEIIYNKQQTTQLNVMNHSKQINEKKLKMKNLPRIKEPISEDFKRDNVDVGISSKRLVPKGRREHKKMAHSSLTVLESNNNLDTIEEEETSDEEEIEEIEIEDAEILDNVLDNEEDNTIDPIIKKGDKMNIKEIAAEMAKDRGPVDDNKNM